MSDAEVFVEEATPEVSVRIAIRELEKALARPDHLGVYVGSALIWLRGLDGAAAPACDHPGIEHGMFSNTGICPMCRQCKWIGHGPLCGDCYDASATQQAT